MLKTFLLCSLSVRPFLLTFYFSSVWHWHCLCPFVCLCESSAMFSVRDSLGRYRLSRPFCRYGHSLKIKHCDHYQSPCLSACRLCLRVCLSISFLLLFCLFVFLQTFACVVSIALSCLSTPPFPLPPVPLPPPPSAKLHPAFRAACLYPAK